MHGGAFRDGHRLAIQPGCFGEELGGHAACRYREDEFGCGLSVRDFKIAVLIRDCDEINPVHRAVRLAAGREDYSLLLNDRIAQDMTLQICHAATHHARRIIDRCSRLQAYGSQWVLSPD